jgi:hypothetical protein
MPYTYNIRQMSCANRFRYGKEIIACRSLRSPSSLPSCFRNADISPTPIPFYSLPVIGVPVIFYPDCFIWSTYLAHDRYSTLQGGENSLPLLPYLTFPLVKFSVYYICDYNNKSRTLPEKRRLRLAEASFVRKKQNLVFSGPTGVGKTYIANALGRALCGQGTAVLYTRLPELFLKLSGA